MISESEYKEAIAKSESAQKIINAYGKQEIERFNERWERFEQGEPFKDEELIYSAFDRCNCGYGLAYPKNCTGNHQWTCAKVLKGIGTDGGHKAFPFSMYEIKSEIQPSASGATTRAVK